MKSQRKKAKWWQSRSEEERNEGAVEGFQIGGSELSITRNRQLQQEIVHLTTTEVKWSDPRDILRNYDVLGTDSEGNWIVRPKRKGSRILSEDEIDDMLGI